MSYTWFSELLCHVFQFQAVTPFASLRSLQLAEDCSNLSVFIQPFTNCITSEIEEKGIIERYWQIWNWLVVWNIYIYILPYIGNWTVIPIDFHILQRGRSTTNQWTVGWMQSFGRGLRQLRWIPRGRYSLLKDVVKMFLH